MSWPVAELEVDERVVRSLLSEQHPDLAQLQLTQVDSGWDNMLWRLGAGLLVRLPRHKMAAPLTLNEQRWLPGLAPHLPLPVPTPIRIGRPTAQFPWSWTVVPWLSGVPGDRAALTEPEDAAGRLGRFLRALHRGAPPDAPHNPFRGVPLKAQASAFEDRVITLASELDVQGTRRVWDRALAVESWSEPPVWIHGDLHPANVLVHKGTIKAIIDFGDLCAGDPATDLAAAWMVLPASVTKTFELAYGGFDTALERRALGWGVLFALMLLGVGLTTRPTYQTVGQSTLARVISHSENAT